MLLSLLYEPELVIAESKLLMRNDRVSTTDDRFIQFTYGKVWKSWQQRLLDKLFLESSEATITFKTKICLWLTMLEIDHWEFNLRFH